MNYSFLGYNTPDLQLGQDDWMNASTPTYNAQTQAVLNMLNRVGANYMG